jgi:hypothetical protein
MALIFQDRLQVEGATGLYTLMAYINGIWTDIHTIADAMSGSIEIDAALHTIPVDTTLLNAGQTYLFKWVDSAATESNINRLTIPIDITISMVVLSASEVSLTLDGRGTIDWGDDSVKADYAGDLPEIFSHHYTPGTYSIKIYDVVGMKTFVVPGNANAYATSIDQMPDTLIHFDIHGNKIGDTGLPNGPALTNAEYADLSGNLFSAGIIDAVLQLFAYTMTTVMTIRLRGQAPPAPPSAASAAALAVLYARGATVVHD